MVIIESAPNGGEDEDTSTQINVVESNSSSIKSTEETNNDGFETASEGDGAREEEEEEPVLAPSPSNEELQQGRYEETIKECNKALELNPAYMKALIRRGEAHEKLEHFEEAVIDMKKIVELDPSNNQARRSIVRLEPLAAEKREKMKEEMIGKS
ncbi:hypothetical protein C5167_049190 [Papaver somniferum]|uniref:Uncharacterized protein n=1 Tax=Papaver somniferum TaxID=3469 RepID=A0A4Y7KLI3_PAPSO|nr:hypothetical protein C5167_049190 [Papaver somniferum]